MKWPLPILLATVAVLLWTAASPHSDRFVELVKADDHIHVWINPNAVAQVRESITDKKRSMIVFSTGVWIDVVERPAHVVQRLSE